MHRERDKEKMSSLSPFLSFFLVSVSRLLLFASLRLSRTPCLRVFRLRTSFSYFLFFFYCLRCLLCLMDRASQDTDRVAETKPACEGRREPAERKKNFKRHRRRRRRRRENEVVVFARSGRRRDRRRQERSFFSLLVTQTKRLELYELSKEFAGQWNERRGAHYDEWRTTRSIERGRRWQRYGRTAASTGSRF